MVHAEEVLRAEGIIGSDESSSTTPSISLSITIQCGGREQPYHRDQPTSATAR